MEAINRITPLNHATEVEARPVNSLRQGATKCGTDLSSIGDKKLYFSSIIFEG